MPQFPQSDCRQERGPVEVTGELRPRSVGELSGTPGGRDQLPLVLGGRTAARQGTAGPPP